MRRSRFFYAFTIFSPAPSSHVRRLLAVISISRCRASLVAHAMCGVSRAFGRPRKGLACGRKAICNCRRVNGRFVFEGEQVAIDLENDVQYVSMCPQCYFKAKRAFYAEKAASQAD